MALARHLRPVVVPGRSQLPPSAPSGSTPALRALLATPHPFMPPHDRPDTHPQASDVPACCRRAQRALPLPPPPPAATTWNRPGGMESPGRLRRPAGKCWRGAGRLAFPELWMLPTSPSAASHHGAQAAVTGRWAVGAARASPFAAGLAGASFCLRGADPADEELFARMAARYPRTQLALRPARRTRWTAARRGGASPDTRLPVAPPGTCCR